MDYISDSSLTGWSNSCTYYCNGYYIIGGYECFGAGASTQKTYAITQAHYQVSVWFVAYWIDSWDSEELLQLYVDGTQRFSQAKPGSMGYLCGIHASYYEDYYAGVSTSAFSHTSSSITLRFTSTLDQGSTDESFGFRDILITIWPCDTACSACYGNLISQCTSCNSGYYLSGNTCVTDCGAYYWNNPTGRVCSRNFYLNFHSIYTFFFSLSFFLL